MFVFCRFFDLIFFFSGSIRKLDIFFSGSGSRIHLIWIDQLAHWRFSFESPLIGFHFGAVVIHSESIVEKSDDFLGELIAHFAKYVMFAFLQCLLKVVEF
jgi:hypothetical protein